MEYCVINLSEVEVCPISYLIPVDFVLIVKSHDSLMPIDPIPVLCENYTEHKYKYKLNEYSLVPVPYESCLFILESVRAKEPLSCCICYTEPFYVPNSHMPIKFIGYKSSHNSLELIHIYFSETIPPFTPTQNSTARGVYSLSGPEETLCKLDIAWEYPLKLSSAPGHSCKSCIVYAKGSFGNSPLLGNLYKDLNTIKILLENNHRFGFPTSCLDKLEKFIDREIKIFKGDNYTTEKEIQTIREEKIAQFCGMQEKNDADITDRLWDLLKTSKNIEEMKKSFFRIIDSIKNKMFIPIVSYRNNTKLAGYLNSWKSIVHNNKFGVSGEGYQSEKDWHNNIKSKSDDIIEIVTEIGLNKLGYDFSDYLITGKFCNPEDTHFFLSQTPGNKLKRLENLEKLLKLLQIAIILKSAGLKVHVINHILIPLVQYYKSYNGFPLVINNLTFNIEVPCLNSYQIEYWEAMQETFHDSFINKKKYCYTNNDWWVVDTDAYDIKYYV
jgi:RZZ complex, subunit zwilch